MSLELPAPDHTPLTKSPLLQVLCQLRFEEHANVSDPHVARGFHEALGGSGGQYPTAQSLVGGQRVTIAISPTGQPVADTKPSEGWRFSSSDGASAVTLFPDSVGLETTAYKTWPEFADRIASVINVLVDQVAPAFEQRLGIRFVNRIQNQGIQSPAAWDGLLSEYLLGPILHPGLASAVRGTQQIVQLDLGDGVACGLRHLLVPADANRAEFDYLIDLDVFRERGIPFDPAGVESALTTFNDYAVQLFQAVVKPELLERLR
jgi:uncharacterized protein (TIGR04255 family)